MIKNTFVRSENFLARKKLFILFLGSVIFIFFIFYMPTKCEIITPPAFNPGIAPQGVMPASPLNKDIFPTHRCFSPLHKEFWGQPTWVIEFHWTFFPTLEKEIWGNDIIELHK